MPHAINEQLDKDLADAHSIEEQALIQMRLAPRLARRPPLSTAFREHLAETERHERLVRERLEARGASPSRFKDLVMKAGDAGFALFAKSQPDAPGTLTAHAYSYEYLELASYELLLRVAERAGDEQTAAVARAIRDEEHAMAERLTPSSTSRSAATSSCCASRGAPATRRPQRWPRRSSPRSARRPRSSPPRSTAPPSWRSRSRASPADRGAQAGRVGGRNQE